MTLLSVIIPSAGRRLELLNKAIQSTFFSDPDIDIEVLVILNGQDGLNFDTKIEYQDSRVKYFRLKEGNVSKARNFGLKHSTGDYVRFLDDDDYLCPEVSKLQVQRMMNTNEDVSSFGIQIVDDYGNIHGATTNNSESTDGIIRLLNVNCVVLPLAHLFKRSFIQDCVWNENRCNAEDLEWLHEVARKKPKWTIYNECVGYWYQHNDDLRLSYSSINQDATRVCAEQVIKTFNVFKNDFESLNLNKIVANGLWKVIHKAFYLSPMYWTKIALYAKSLDSSSHPNESIFIKLPYPILIEWIMIPKRIGNHLWRILKGKIQNNHYIRKF